ncbi:hypothetical protein [Ekhidna sp.]|uniref:hypothetical protein n=1 Tax=Ekhidna sp. TaxID=2608089 RepID=UPI003516A038
MIYWILNIALLAGFSYLSFRLVKSTFNPWVFWIALGLKLTAGLILGLIFYEYYGTGDTITFFEAAKSFNLENLNGQPRTQFFILILRPIVLITGGSYWLSSLWLSFISFVASWYAVIMMISLYPNLRAIISISFLFIPSVVFWSSGIMKDTIAFAALSIIVSLLLVLYERFKIRTVQLLILIIASYMLYQIKHYLFITSLVFAGGLLASMLFKKIKNQWRWIITLSIFIAALSATQFIHPYLEVDRIPWTLYENNSAILEKSDPEDRLNIVIENDSWSAVISEIPTSLHAGLFRPSIFDQTPVWGWVHRVENLILTSLIIMSILLYFKQKPKVDWVLFCSALACILLLAIMLPLSTPNFGTLVRYKNAFMPFLFLISSILPYQYLTSKTSD